jgi:hypothetical protein
MSVFTKTVGAIVLVWGYLKSITLAASCIASLRAGAILPALMRLWVKQASAGIAIVSMFKKFLGRAYGLENHDTAAAITLWAFLPLSVSLSDEEFLNLLDHIFRPSLCIEKMQREFR